MTVEHRFIAGLGDIRAVTCECLKCGARLSLSPDSIGSNDFYQCPSCKEHWISPGTSQGRLYSSDLLTLLRALAPSRKTQPDGTDSAVHVRILLEFDEPARS